MAGRQRKRNKAKQNRKTSDFHYYGQMVCIPVTNQPLHLNPRFHLFWFIQQPCHPVIPYLTYIYSVCIDWMIPSIISIYIKLTPWSDGPCSPQPTSLFFFEEKVLEKVVYPHFLCFFISIINSLIHFSENLILPTQLKLLSSRKSWLSCCRIYRSMLCPYLYLSVVFDIVDFSLLEMLY